jgi:hypothetical protein
MQVDAGDHQEGLRATAQHSSVATISCERLVMTKSVWCVRRQGVVRGL